MKRKKQNIEEEIERWNARSEQRVQLMKDITYLSVFIAVVIMIALIGIEVAR